MSMQFKPSKHSLRTSQYETNAPRHNPDAWSNKAANLQTLNTIRSLVDGNTQYSSFQSALTEVTKAVHRDGGQNLAQAPSSLEQLYYKACASFLMLALLAKPNSAYRENATKKAAEYRDKAALESSADASVIADRAKSLESDFQAAYAMAIVLPGVDSSEVFKWAKYCMSIFGFSFNTELISRAQSYEQITPGDQVVTAAQTVTDAAASGAAQAMATAQDLAGGARKLSTATLMLPFVLPLVTSASLISVLAAVMYRRSKNKAKRKQKKLDAEASDV
jgi:hypothetical protein